MDLVSIPKWMGHTKLLARWGQSWYLWLPC